MKKNIHPLERGILFGIVPLATGLMGWCPPYAMLGINTCHIGKK